MFGEFASSNRSLLFISNLSHDNDTSVTLGGMVYHVPRWSVTIVQGPAYAPRILYNTAYIDAVIGRSTYRYEVVSEAQLPLVKSRAEPVGISQQGRARFQTTPAEQISFTRDTTDYLWYVLPHLPEEMSRAVKAAQLADIPTVNLTFSEVHDHATVYFNGQRIGDARGGHNVTFPIAVTLFVYPWEDNSIAVLTQTMGLSNYGPHREEWSRGITGTVVFAGVDLTEGGWLHQAGLLGEQQKVFEGVNDDAFKDVAVTTTVDPLTWLRIDLPEVYISTDYDDAAYVVDMVSMVKGVAWMNGHPLGRYWSLTAKLPTSPINSTDPYPFPGDGVTGGVSTLESEAPTQPFLCNYAGPFSQDKCRDPKSVGQPTQRYYHIPRAWIHGKGEGNNTLVLFEEQGGDLKCVRLLKVVREVVSRVESMPALKMQV